MALVCLATPASHTPTISELLPEDQALIDSHYMRQLLEYGMRRARQYPDDAPELSPDALLKEAEVSGYLPYCDSWQC